MPATPPSGPPGSWGPPPPPGHTHLRPGTPGWTPPPGGGYPPSGPPSGPPQWPTPTPGGPPPRRNTGLVVTLVVVVVLAVAAVSTLGVVLLTGDDDEGRDAAGRSASPDPTATGSESATEAPSPEETGPASEAVPPPTTPTTPDSSSTPPSPEPPPTEAPAAQKFSYTEYGDNWRFRLGDVQLRATFVQGWDYPTCGPAEKDGALTDLGCVRASEWTYRALKGDLALTQVVYTMRDERAATRLIKRQLISEDSWQVKRASTLPGRAGSWRANTTGVYVVLTVETHESSVPLKRAASFVNYGNADIVGALRFSF